jgi:hypothetical protein
MRDIRGVGAGRGRQGGGCGERIRCDNVMGNTGAIHRWDPSDLG